MYIISSIQFISFIQNNVLFISVSNLFCSMEKAYDKQDLNRFFSGIKSKYVIPRPSTNILGKVTCRNGLEYIEKPYNTYGGISNFGVKVDYFVYFVFCIYFHEVLTALLEGLAGRF